MAKVEQSPETNTKKSNKKRKHNKDVTSDTAESPSGKFKKIDINDGAATKHKRKSTLPAATHAAKSVTTTTTVPHNKSPKKRKRPVANHEPTDEDDAQSPADIVGPSADQLSQSDLPANRLAIETVRQRKRMKHQHLTDTKQQSSTERDMQRNKEYLRQWSTNRDQWKFEKLRQISIQTHMFDETIDDEWWTMTKEYLSGAKGAARLAILKKAETVIGQLDATIATTGNADVTQSKNYERAREMLQFLQ